MLFTTTHRHSDGWLPSAATPSFVVCVTRVGERRGQMGLPYPQNQAELALDPAGNKEGS